LVVLEQEDGVLHAAGDFHDFAVGETLDGGGFEHHGDEVVELVGVGLHALIEVFVH